MTNLSSEEKSGSEARPHPSPGRGAPPTVPIEVQSRAAWAALRALNNANARETSFLTAEDWDALVANSFTATCTAWS